MIQQNAAAAEEMSSTAEELASQSEHLQDTIGFFRVEEYKSVPSSAQCRAVPRPAVKKAAPGKAVRMNVANGSGAALQMQQEDAEFETF